MSIEALREFVNRHPELAPTNAEVLAWVANKAGLPPPDRARGVEAEAQRLLKALMDKYGH